MRQHRVIFVQGYATRTKAQLEEIFMNGFADEVSGDVESPMGHFYRVENQIMFTDSQGFSEVSNFKNEETAQKAFMEIDVEYSSWKSGQEPEDGPEDEQE